MYYINPKLSLFNVELFTNFTFVSYYVFNNSYISYLFYISFTNFLFHLHNLYFILHLMLIYKFYITLFTNDKSIYYSYFNLLVSPSI